MLPPRLPLFGLFILLAAASNRIHADTVVVALWNSDEIVVAADSKGVGPGNRTVQVCKIRKFGDYFYAIAGTDAYPETDFYVSTIAEDAANSPGTFLGKIREFERIVVSPLRKALDHLKVSDPLDYELNVERKSGHALDIVFFGIDSGSLFLKVRRFGTKDFSKEYGQANFPEENAVFFGEHEAITRFRKANPDWRKQMGLVDAARKFVELEIQEVPKTVGPPINILVVDRSGARWAFPPQGCPELACP